MNGLANIEITKSSLLKYIPYTGATTNVDLGLHNLTVDTSTLFVDSVNHKVGIGTTSPDTKLHINDGELRFTHTQPTGGLQSIGEIQFINDAFGLTAGGTTAEIIGMTSVDKS